MEAWLLDEEELAELEPRDFRGAAAATAADTNTLMTGCVITHEPGSEAARS